MGPGMGTEVWRGWDGVGWDGLPRLHSYRPSGGGGSSGGRAGINIRYTARGCRGPESVAGVAAGAWEWEVKGEGCQMGGSRTGSVGTPGNG